MGLAVLGSVFLLVWTESPKDGQAPVWFVYACGAVALGLAGTGLRIELGRYFGYLGMRRTVFVNLMGFLAALALFVVVYRLNAVVLWGLTLLLLPASIQLLRVEIGKVPHREFYRPALQEKLNVPLKFLVTALIQGLTFGVVCGLILASPSFQTRGLISATGLLLAFLLVLVSFAFVRFDFNMLVYQVGFPVLTCGFLAMGLFAPCFEVGAALLIAGFFYLEMILWALGAFLIRNQHKPAGWVILLPTFALMAGRSLGGALIMLVGSWAAPWEKGEPALVIAAFCIILAALFMSSNVNLRYGWGFIRHDEAEEFQGRVEACRLIAADTELTNRELEILILVAQGRNRKAIAESLHVTMSTVKTHLLSLYRKLGMHSRDEVMRLVEDTERSCGAAGAEPPGVRGEPGGLKPPGDV
jgi:DNA-binding CsgD family transcriptional regulator